MMVAYFVNIARQLRRQWKSILTTGKRYDALYGLFNEAFEDTVIEHPIEWHNSLISQKLCC